jgi:glycosidase
MMDVNQVRSSQYLNFKKPNNPPIKFTGHKLNNGKFEFFVPGSASSKGQVNIVREDGTTEKVNLKYKNGMLVAEAEKKSASERVKYNFTIDGKTQVDLTEQTPDGKYALTRNPNLIEHTKPHNLYHVLPDSFNPDNVQVKVGKNGQLSVNGLKNKGDSKVLDKDGNFLWRNHFDLYGGNIDGVIKQLDYIKSLGASRIMGTPIFGKDSISNHGYWTENPYQIAQRMGNVQKFDELNIELFKRGMAWIADGAFVNQGIKGVQFQDVLRRAAHTSDESPFKNWFTLYKDPCNDFVMGVLPQNDHGEIVHEAYEIDFENAPIKKDGQTNPDFDAKKPTFLIINDPRPSKQNEGVHVSTESTQVYKFPVDPKEVQEKFDVWGEVDKENFLEWKNFTLDTSFFDSQKQLWNGNRDVLKMNMQNPLVREYIMKAGEFWTARADNALLNYVSANINKELKGAEPTAENISKVVEKLEKDGVLPQGSSELNKTEIEQALQNKDLARLPNHSSLYTAVASYPLEAIELPNELTAIITSPRFQNDIKKIYTKEVAKTIDSILSSDKLSQETKQKLTDPEVIRVISQDLAKTIMTKAITGVEHWTDRDEKPGTNWREKLADGAAKTLPPNIYQASADTASDLLVKAIRENVASVDTGNVATLLECKVQNLDTPTIKTAKALLNKMESGLDWRIDAAKDVADLDAVVRGELDATEARKFASDFWKEFSSRVREINPNTYIIGEVTEGDQFLKPFITDGENQIFSSLSNYRYMWGQPYRFVHAHPEPQYGWNYGPSGFFNDLQDFLKAWPITAVNTSHNMLDNHDKQMVLHNLLIHPGDFMDGEPKGPEYSMKAVLKQSLCEASGLTAKKDTNPLEIAKKDLTKADNKVIALVEEAINQTAKEAGEQFGFWSIPRLFTNIQKKAEEIVSGQTNSSLPASVKNADVLKNVAPKLNDMSRVMFDRITDKYLRVLYLQVGVPGAPEIYNGTDIGLTGGESNKVNNKYIQNRNPMPWVWLDAKSGKNEVINFNNQVRQIFSMRQNKNLQVLNDGFVKDIGVQDDNKGILAFLRYNDKQQALVILNNGQVAADANAANYSSGDLRGNLSVTEPVVKNYKLDLKNSGIEEGTEFINAANPGDVYVVNKGELVSKADPAKGLDVQHGMILYKKGNAAALQPKQPAFTGLKKLNQIV